MFLDERHAPLGRNAKVLGGSLCELLENFPCYPRAIMLDCSVDQSISGEDTMTKSNNPTYIDLVTARDNLQRAHDVLGEKLNQLNESIALIEELRENASQLLQPMGSQRSETSVDTEDVDHSSEDEPLTEDKEDLESVYSSLGDSISDAMRSTQPKTNWSDEVARIVAEQGGFIHQNVIKYALETRGYQGHTSTVSSMIRNLVSSGKLVKIRYNKSVHYVFYGLPEWIEKNLFGQPGKQIAPDREVKGYRADKINPSEIEFEWDPRKRKNTAKGEA